MFFLLLTIIKIHAVNSQIFSWYWRVAMNESFDMIEASFTQYMVLCAIWYHCCNLKNVKNTYGRVLLLVKLQAEVTLFHGCFSHFLNCAHDTKSRNTPHISDL